MKRYQNVILLLIVASIAIYPLVTTPRPTTENGSESPEIFTGADGQAKDLVASIAPGYRPWATPLLEPPSGEIESLLFALQAAIGAGVIGYWYGCARTRREYESGEGSRVSG